MKITITIDVQDRDPLEHRCPFQFKASRYSSGRHGYHDVNSVENAYYLLLKDAEQSFSKHFSADFKAWAAEAKASNKCATKLKAFLEGGDPNEIVAPL